MRIGGQDVLLPTTMVGSYPRPNWLRGKVFSEFDEPDYIDYSTKEAFEDAVRLCVDDQIRAGLDIVMADSATSEASPRNRLESLALPAPVTGTSWTYD